VERTSRFVIIAGPSAGKDADILAEILIDMVNAAPDRHRQSLTSDQGTDMGRQAELTLATDMPVTFAYPHPHVSGPPTTTPPA
jgi:IS30 family transposase